MPTIEKMKETSAFVSVASAEKMLGKTEPVSTAQITDESTVSFNFEDAWNVDLDQKSDLAAVAASVTVDGKEYELSKTAALAVGSVFGIQSTYSKKIPGSIYNTLLNYHYGSLTQDRAALVVGDRIHGLIRPGMSVYSNLDMLEQVVGGIKDVYGNDTLILVDRRSFNNLNQTDIRLVIPEVERAIKEGGMLDVPAGEQDDWSAGIHISNSVSGKSQTSIQTYLFRYWCANGATVKNESVGNWHRAYDASTDIYEWSRENTKEILTGMEAQFDKVQALTAVDADGRIGQIVNEALRPLRISASHRQDVAESLLDYDDVSLYTVMNAVTQQANTPGMNQDYINRFMVAGGNFAAGTVTSEKALTWREGHLAPPTAKNPYEIG